MSSKGWWKCKLDDLIERRNQGVNTTTERVKYSEKGIPVIRAQNITSSGLSFDDIVYVTSETFARVREECKPIKNDVLYTNIGSQFGTACVVDVDYPFLIAWNVLRIQTKKGTNPFFLKYILNNPQIKSMIRGMNSSSTMPFVSGKEIGNIDLLVPNFFIQTRIADILSALDDKIALNRQANQTLEAMAQAIYKEWFVNFNFPGTTGEMQDSELGPIPRDWRVGGIGSLCFVQNGYAFKSDTFSDEVGNCGVIKIKNIGSNLVDVNDMQYVAAECVADIDPKFKIKPESLLIAMTGAEVGKIGLVPLTDKELWLNQRVGVFIEKITNSNYFLYILLSGDDYQNIIRNSAIGSAQPNISASAIEDIKIVLPPEKLIINFGEVIKPLFDKLLRNVYESNLLNQIRNHLLPKLMSGEIEA